MTRTLASVVVVMVLGCSATAPNALAHPRSARRSTARNAWVHELPPESAPAEPAPATPPPSQPPTDPWRDPIATIGAAMEHADPGPRRVLETTRAMISDGVVVRGSCYTWLNAVYRRAGGRARTVFQGPQRAPFTAFELLAPGDWVFFINHSYGDVTHSAIFLAWIDRDAHVALMASYPGGNRNEPGRFSDYELTNVYQIVRKADALDEPAAPRRASRRARSR